jgi:hypothetical protein
MLRSLCIFMFPGKADYSFNLKRPVSVSQARIFCILSLHPCSLSTARIQSRVISSLVGIASRTDSFENVLILYCLPTKTTNIRSSRYGCLNHGSTSTYRRRGAQYLCFINNHIINRSPPGCQMLVGIVLSPDYYNNF